MTGKGQGGCIGKAKSRSLTAFGMTERKKAGGNVGAPDRNRGDRRAFRDDSKGLGVAR